MNACKRRRDGEKKLRAKAVMDGCHSRAVAGDKGEELGCLLSAL